MGNTLSNYMTSESNDATSNASNTDAADAADAADATDNTDAADAADNTDNTNTTDANIIDVVLPLSQSNRKVHFIEEKPLEDCNLLNSFIIDNSSSSSDANTTTTKPDSDPNQTRNVGIIETTTVSAAAATIDSSEESEESLYFYYNKNHTSVFDRINEYVWDEWYPDIQYRILYNHYKWDTEEFMHNMSIKSISSNMLSSSSETASASITEDNDNITLASLFNKRMYRSLFSFSGSYEDIKRIQICMIDSATELNKFLRMYHSCNDISSDSSSNALNALNDSNVYYIRNDNSHNILIKPCLTQSYEMFYSSGSNVGVSAEVSKERNNIIDHMTIDSTMSLCMNDDFYKTLMKQYYNSSISCQNLVRKQLILETYNSDEMSTVRACMFAYRCALDLCIYKYYFGDKKEKRRFHEIEQAYQKLFPSHLIDWDRQFRDICNSTNRLVRVSIRHVLDFISKKHKKAYERSIDAFEKRKKFITEWIMMSSTNHHNQSAEEIPKRRQLSTSSLLIDNSHCFIAHKSLLMMNIDTKNSDDVVLQRRFIEEYIRLKNRLLFEYKHPNTTSPNKKRTTNNQTSSVIRTTPISSKNPHHHPQQHNQSSNNSAESAAASYNHHNDNKTTASISKNQRKKNRKKQLIADTAAAVETLLCPFPELVVERICLRSVAFIHAINQGHTIILGYRINSDLLKQLKNIYESDSRITTEAMVPTLDPSATSDINNYGFCGVIFSYDCTKDCFLLVGSPVNSVCPYIWIPAKYITHEHFSPDAYIVRMTLSSPCNK